MQLITPEKLNFSWVSDVNFNTTNIIIIINCNWVVTRWQWLFNTYTKHELTPVVQLAETFLGVLIKLRKVNISTVTSVCPYGKTRLPLHIFSWNLILVVFFETLSGKFKFHWNMTRIRTTLHEDTCTFRPMTTPRWIPLRILTLQAKVVQKSRTYFMFKFFFLSKILPLWDSVENMVQSDKSRMTTEPCTCISYLQNLTSK
jgi:hypothetical protein